MEEEEEITKYIHDDAGNIVSRSEIKKNEFGKVISEKYYNKNNVLFEECERFYNDDKKQIKVIKNFPIKQTSTIFEYKYDEKGKYKEISQTDIVTMIEHHKIQKYNNGKFFKETYDVYPTVHLTRVIDEEKHTQSVYCNGKVLIEDCKSIHFDNLLHEVSDNKIYTNELGVNELLNHIVESIIKKDWHTVTELADELHEYAEDELCELTGKKLDQ